MYFGLLKGSDMIDSDSEHIPYHYVIYSDGVAHHKIDGSIIEGLVKKIVSGVLIEQGVYKKGLKEGVWENFRSDRKLRQRQCYRGGLLEGSHEWFHTNGNIRETGQYENGDRVGIWLSFDRFGNLTSALDLKTVELATKYKKTTVQPDTRAHPDSLNGLKSSLLELSERRIFSHDGLAFNKSDETLANGVFLKKYRNGTVEVVGVYKDGLKEGPWKEFRSNGRLKLNSNYDKGKLNGLWEWFNSNGKIREKGFYKNGVKTGVWEERDSGGQLTDRINLSSNKATPKKISATVSQSFENNSKNRETQIDGVSQLYEHEIYVLDGVIFSAKNNNPIEGRFVSRKANGDIVETGECSGGIRKGEWKIFRINGKLKQKQNYKNGKLDGLWEWFHDNGNIRERGFCKSGNRIGEWQSFDRFGNHTKTIVQKK